MADEEKNEQEQEETPEAGDEQAADQAPAEEPAPEETPAEEQAPDETPKEVEAPAGEADSDGSDDEAAEAEDASSDEGAEAPAAEAPGGEAEEEVGDWKIRRRLERSRRPAEPQPQQSPEERAKARAEARRQAARRRSSYRAKSRTKRQPGTGTPPAERRSAGRKVRQGRVVSSKPDKTITVQIEVARRHPQYEKIVRRSRTLHAHDARNEAGEGDLVKVVETRPLSRTKRWRLIEILEKAK
jgi:small subunit ribosomal protein S17